MRPVVQLASAATRRSEAAWIPSVAMTRHAALTRRMRVASASVSLGMEDSYSYHKRAIGSEVRSILDHRTTFVARGICSVMSGGQMLMDRQPFTGARANKNDGLAFVHLRHPLLRAHRGDDTMLEDSRAAQHLHRLLRRVAT